MQVAAANIRDHDLLFAVVLAQFEFSGRRVTQRATVTASCPLSASEATANTATGCKLQVAGCR